MKNFNVYKELSEVFENNIIFLFRSETSK